MPFLIANSMRAGDNLYFSPTSCIILLQSTPSRVMAAISSRAPRGTTRYSQTSLRCPQTSPSRMATFCIPRNISIDLETVLLYDLGSCIASIFGQASTIWKMSAFDGLKAICTMRSVGCSSGMSSRWEMILIFMIVAPYFFKYVIISTFTI